MYSKAIPLDEVGDISAPPGSREWALAVRLELQSVLHDTTYSGERLQRLLRAMEQHAGYQHLAGSDGEPFLTYRAFCIAAPPFGLGYDPAVLDRLGREGKTAQTRMADVAPLRSPGRPSNKGMNHTISSRGADYESARLKRDHPDIVTEIERGEHRSAHSAAKKAGFAKDRWNLPAHSLEAMAIYLRRRLSADQRAELVRRLGAE